ISRYVESISRKSPPHLVLYFALAGYLGSDEAEIAQSFNVEDYVRKIYLGDERVPIYLKNYIDNDVSLRGGVIHDAVVGSIFSHYQFKKYLFEKNLKFVILYNKSKYLKSRLDF